MSKMKFEKLVAGSVEEQPASTRRQGERSVTERANELLQLIHGSEGPFSEEQLAWGRDHLLQAMAQEALDDAEGFDPFDKPDLLWQGLVADDVRSFAADDGRGPKKAPARRGRPAEELIVRLVGSCGAARLVVRGQDILLLPEAGDPPTELTLGGQTCRLECLRLSPLELRVLDLSIPQALAYRSALERDPASAPATWR